MVLEIHSSRRSEEQIDKQDHNDLQSNSARNCFRPHRKSPESGGKGDTGPSNDTLVPDQSFRGHTLLARTLRQKHSGSCQHMESRWASSGVSIWPWSLHRTRRICCHIKNVTCEPACPSCPYTTRQFSRSSMSQSRHRRAQQTTLATTKNSEGRAQPSRCEK